MLLFAPGDDHACTQSGEGPLSYRGWNVPKEAFRAVAGQVDGGRELWSFSENVVSDERIAGRFREVHEAMMNGAFGLEGSGVALLADLVQRYGGRARAARRGESVT